MDLQQISDWLTSTGLSQAIQLSTWAIPTIQTVHILSLALLFAAALIVGLRFFGRGLAVEPLHLLARRFIRLIWLLVVVLAVTGLLLIIAEPHRTIGNPVFYLKMVLLLVAIVVTAWLSSVSSRQHDRLTGVHRFAAALSVVLWIGIMFAGRFIAYYDPY
ncbi:MAG: hypothetical protein DIU62_001200 [Pseudomonadota bacterium]